MQPHTHDSGRIPFHGDPSPAPQRPLACQIKFGIELPAKLQVEVIQAVSALTQSYAAAGDFVLPQTPERVARALHERRLLVALDSTGTEFVGAAKWVPLHTVDGILRVAEVGSLVRAPHAKGYGSPSPVAQCVAALVKDLESKNVLAIATARSDKSRTCLTQGGMFDVRWSALSALSALTCDPGCAPGPHGSPAWTGCGTTISCGARKTEESSRIDACSLFVSNRERAISLNDSLLETVAAQDEGCFSALRFRAAIGFRTE